MNEPSTLTVRFLLAARQLQLVEERYKDRRPGSFEAQDAESDFHLYAGTATRGTICVAPALSEWIATQLQKEASVAKERRKAREERALARPKGKGKDKNQGKDKEGE